MAQMLEIVTGYKAGHDYEQVNLGWEAAAQSFQDHRIDVYINPTLPPSPVIQQFALTSKVRLLGLSEKDMASEAFQAFSHRPGGLLDTIPPGPHGDNPLNRSEKRRAGKEGGRACKS